MDAPPTAFLDEARRHLDVQLAASRDVDGRAIEVVKLNGVVLAIVVAAAGLTSEEATASIGTAAVLFAGLGAALLAASTLAAAVTFIKSELGTGVHGFSEAIEMKVTPDQTVVLLVEVYDEILAHNKETIERKARRVDRSVLLFVAGVGTFSVAAALFIVGLVL